MNQFEFFNAVKKCSKTQLEPVAKMAIQQGTHLVNLLVQKSQIHIQIGHAQNQINHIQTQIISNQHSALNIVHVRHNFKDN